MAKAQYKRFTSPVGRLVKGAPSRGYGLDDTGNPKKFKSGIHMGEPRTDYYMGVAFEKNGPGVEEFIQLMKDTAAEHVPVESKLPDFSFKITDGDSTKPNKKNKRPCDQEGYPGCHVVAFSNTKVAVCFTAGGASVIPAEEVKTGFYVCVAGSICGHAGSNPGLYMNHEAVELVAFGDEITTRPTGTELFGGSRDVVLPAGARKTPSAPKTAPRQPSSGPKPPPIDESPEYEPTCEIDGESFTKKDLEGFGWTPAQIAKCTFSAPDNVPF